MAHVTNGFRDSQLVKVPETELGKKTIEEKDRFGFDVTADEASYEFCVSLDVLRKREKKWQKMVNSFDKFKRKKPEILKSRCRKGVPYSMRGLAWEYLTGADKLISKNKGLFNKLLEKDSTEYERDLGMVMKDLHRTFPKHELFSSAEGQTSLQQLLTALLAYNPDHGYCQAMSPVVATLLMHMPVERAFWVMVRIMEDYLNGYYTEGFQVFQIDCELFDMLLEIYAPALSKHMKSIGAMSVVYLLEWFMCIFCRTLPFSCALRIYDMFLCEGPIVMFKTGLAILKLYMEDNENYKNYPSIADFYPALKHLPSEVTHEKNLIPCLLSFKIPEKLLTRLKTRAAKKFTKQEEERHINRMQNAESMCNIPHVDVDTSDDDESSISVSSP